MATAIFATDEYRQDLVVGYYLHYLDRPVDPGGLAAWTMQLKAGVRDEVVIAGIEDSEAHEFFNKVLP